MLLRFPVFLLLIAAATAPLRSASAPATPSTPAPRAAGTPSAAASAPDDAIERVWRLYDLTPVSADNPVLASVKECGIEIPLSELRAYVRTDTPPNRVGKMLTGPEKQRELQKLVDDYFWIWSGYHQHVDQTDPDIRGMLGITRNEALRDLLIKREVESKASSMAEFQLLRKAFVRQLFDRMETHVSPHAVELAKLGARHINAFDASGKQRNAEDDALPDGLTQAQRLEPLATSKLGTLRVGDFLAVYTHPPVAERADLDQKGALEAELAEAYSGALLLAEAEARGLDRDPAVRQQVQSDRTGLVRQWAIEQVARQADEITHDPANAPKLKAWYEAHLASFYTKKDDHGQVHVLPYAPNSDQILSDYFTDLLQRMQREELDRLRHGRTLVIDAKALEAAEIPWFAPPPKLEMPATMITWDADTRAYVVKPGETHASFVFTLKNVSSDLLTIDDIHPVNEFVTVGGPQLPWRLKPGMSADVKLDVDLRDKFGVGTAPIEVLSSVGSKTLTLKITYPPRPEAEAAAPAKPAKST